MKFFVRLLQQFLEKLVEVGAIKGGVSYFNHYDGLKNK